MAVSRGCWTCHRLLRLFLLLHLCGSLRQWIVSGIGGAADVRERQKEFYQRLLIAHSIRHVTSGPPPVEVEAPMCVHTTLMRQRSGGSERLIAHLLNDLNSTAFHALPDNDVPLREETIPLFGIRLTFCPDYQLSRVHLEPEGAELKIERTPNGSSVVVPRLAVHSMVVGELEDSGAALLHPFSSRR